jgi:predicted PurR-regulated permease PerM
MEDQQEIKLPFYARLAAILLSVMLILVIMHEGKSVIIPLFFSVLIAFMLLPLTKWLERRKLPRTISAIIAILLFVAFIGGVFYLLGAQITEFSKDLPQLGERMQTWIANLQGWIAAEYGVDASKQLEYLNDAVTGFAHYASLMAQALLLAVTGFAIWTLFVFIFTYFILTHRNLLRNFVTSLFRRKDQARVAEILSETRILANGYVIGLLIEMVVVAVLNVGFMLIFGVRYALLLGVLAAVMNIIPYLGIYTATAIAALITLSNSTPSHALGVIAILLIIHFVDANMLMPRIVGRRVNMNPLITIVAVLVGNLLWGISGMFLFIPLVGILKIVFGRVEGLKPWAILMGTEAESSLTH